MNDGGFNRDRPLMAKTDPHVATSESEWIESQLAARPFDKPLDPVGAPSLSRWLRAPSLPTGWRSQPLLSLGFYLSGAKPVFRMGLH